MRVFWLLFLFSTGVMLVINCMGCRGKHKIELKGPVLRITTVSLPEATEGQPYNATAEAADGTTPFTWTVTGLPSGLTWSQIGNHIQITGTPDSGTSSDQPYSVIVSVTDSSNPPQTDSKTFQLFVNPVPVAFTEGWERESRLEEGEWSRVHYYLYPYIVHDLRGDGKWVIITGREAYGGYFGFYWDENQEKWVYDADLTDGLEAHGWEEAPALAYDLRGDGKWVLIGHQGSNFYGYFWDGSKWIEDTSLVNGLSGVSGEVKHWLLHDLRSDGKWVLISGTEEGTPVGFYWDGDQWVKDDSLVEGVGKVGVHISVAGCHNLRGDNRWILIVTNYSKAYPKGYYWDGSKWVEDPDIVKGLPEDNRLKPTIGFNVFGDGKWVLFMGHNVQDSIMAYVRNRVDLPLPKQHDIQVLETYATTATITFKYPYTWSHRIRYSSNADMSDSSWSGWVHDSSEVTIKLKNLQPDTTYYFQVYSYVPWDRKYFVKSEVYQFTTEPAQSYFYLTPGGSVSLQEAVQMLPPSGGVIELSEGTFEIDSPICIWSDNVTLKGRGMDKTTITISSEYDCDWQGAWGLSPCIIYISKWEPWQNRPNYIYTHKDETFWFNYPKVPFDDSMLIKNITIQDIALDGKDEVRGIVSCEIMDSTLLRIKSTNTTGAIYVSPGINVLIKDCISEDDVVAYWLTLLSRSCYIKDCRVERSYGWVPAIHTNGSAPCEYKELPSYPPPEIGGNVCVDCIDAIHIYSTSGILVHHNVVDGSTRYGLRVSISGDCHIYDNIIRNCEDWGLCYDEAENCVFERNIVYNNQGDGFVMHDRYDKPRTGIVRNNVFWNNGGHGVHNTKDSVVQKVVIKNNIIGGNGGYGVKGGFEQIIYNCFWQNVDGSYDAGGLDPSNLTSDPYFADVAAGDFHLKSEAGRWDPKQGWVNDGVTSPCIDAGDPNDDFSEEPQPNGGRINLGAYGNTKEASKSKQ